MKQISIFILALIFGILQDKVQSSVRYHKCSRNVSLEEWLRIAEKLFHTKTPLTFTLEPTSPFTKEKLTHSSDTASEQKHLTIRKPVASSSLYANKFEKPQPSSYSFLNSKNSNFNKNIYSEKTIGFSTNYKGYKKNRIMSEHPQTEMVSANNENIENALCIRNVPVDDITYSKSHIFKQERVKVNDVLCIEFEGRVGTGYIWALVGVHDKKPDIDINSLPYEYKKSLHSSSTLIVSTPKKEEVKVNEDMKKDPQKQPDGLQMMGSPVGGSVRMFSRIKALKVGEYYITYAMFRPFSPADAPNIRTIHLIVN